MSQPVPPTVAGETPGENEEKVEDESQEAWPCVDGPMGNGCSAPATRERSRSPPATQAMPMPPMPPRPFVGGGRWIWHPTAEDSMPRGPQWPPAPKPFHQVWVDGAGWFPLSEYDQITGEQVYEPFVPYVPFPMPQLDGAIDGPPSDNLIPNPKFPSPPPSLQPSSSSDCDVNCSSSDTANAQAMTATPDDHDQIAALCVTTCRACADLCHYMNTRGKK
jgi:hypothetical protein